MAELAPPTPGSAYPTTMSVGPPERQGWVERKWSARAIGAIVYFVPFVLSIVAAFALSSVLPVAPNLAVGFLRWIGIASASTIVLILVERQTRRLMPLRTLLGLTLAFPDKAPSRFKIAIRTGTTNQLRQRLDDARDGRLGDTPSEAAERLLELVGMLSHHDRLTRGHSERVRAYSHMIGAEMGLSNRELDRLRWAGLLHDVGKLAIDPDILNKPGKLTGDEFELIKTHPMEGKALVEPLAGWLGEAANAVWEHHERFDGGGYPQGLAGNDISQAARIVSVADVFDVITSVRSYKSATSPRAAREELARCAGTQFDPEVVRAFLALSMGKVRRTMGPLSWFAQLAFLPGAVAAQAGPALATAAVVTAGAAAGTVGIVADPAPAIAQPTESVTIDLPVAAELDGTGSSPDVVRVAATSGGVSFGGSDAGPASPADDTGPADDGDLAVLDIDDGATTPGVKEPDMTTTNPPASPGTTLEPAPVATTARPPGSVTDTTAPATTATTTTSTTSTTTTSTTTTSTTTTSTTTPETVVDIAGEVFLMPVAFGNTTSAVALDLDVDAPIGDILYNYDLDRDSSPGLLIQKDSAGPGGTDPTKVQLFDAVFGEPTRINVQGVDIQLYVAAKDYAKKDINVEVLVELCGSGGACQTLGSGSKRANNANRFKKLTIGLGDFDVVAAAGDRLAVRIAALDDSEDDMWLAYGTTSFDSSIRFQI